jgi:hypothetical protein
VAITLRVSSRDVRELRLDLESVAVGAERQIAGVRREAAELVARVVRPLTPVGPGPILGAKHPDDRLPHIRDTIAARASGVISTHPAAVVHEFGGTITPRGARVQTIRIARAAMAQRAADRSGARVEALLERRFEELLAQAGL